MGFFSKLLGKRATSNNEGVRDTVYYPETSKYPQVNNDWVRDAVTMAASASYNRMLAEYRSAQRSFDAGETTSYTESWATKDVNINDALSRQLSTLWSRSANLARNNEWAQSYLLSLEDNVLGPNGMQLQMRVMRPSGQFNDNVNDAIESAWVEWGKQADVSGLSFSDVESLALATLAKRGEILFRHTRGAGPMGYQIQMLDPVLLDVTLNKTWQGNRIRMGVEIDSGNAPVAYWLQTDTDGSFPAGYIITKKHVRVPASEIVHKFIVEEVGQLRGMPWLTVGAKRLWMLHDFEQSAAVASSNAAKRQGFFFTPTGEAPPGFADTIVSSVLESAKAAGKVLSADEIQQVMASAEKYATTMPGQFDTLPGNTQFQPFESAWPNINADTYVKQQVRGWAAGRGMSYVTLGNDLEAVNYSSAQVGILAEREHFKKIQARLRDWFHNEIFKVAVPYLALSARILTARIPSIISSATWQGRRWSPLDPTKTAKANETNLALNLTSRRRLIMERGDDPDELFAEIQEEEKNFGKVNAAKEVVPPDDNDEDDISRSAKMYAVNGGR